jgi:hypothetical protein
MEEPLSQVNITPNLLNRQMNVCRNFLVSQAESEIPGYARFVVPLPVVGEAFLTGMVMIAVNLNDKAASTPQ